MQSIFQGKQTLLMSGVDTHLSLGGNLEFCEHGPRGEGVSSCNATRSSDKLDRLCDLVVSLAA